MRLHLDTSFLIDWRRQDPRTHDLAREIGDGQHEISIDPVVEAELFAVPCVTEDYVMLFDAVLAIGAVLPLSSQASRLAASWLAPMDEAKRRAHFADALIGAIAQTAEAILVTGDRRIARVLPMPEY